MIQKGSKKFMTKKKLVVEERVVEPKLSDTLILALPAKDK